MYLYVTSEKAYILVYAHTYIHTYIHTSCTLLTFIWVCIRYDSSLGVYALIMCIILCNTFYIVAFQLRSDLHLHLRTNMKVVNRYFKMKTYTYLQRTYIHTYIQECKWQAYILTIQVDAILPIAGQGVGVGVVAAALVVDTLTHSKQSLFHTAYTYSPHTYIHTYIHTNIQTKCTSIS